MGNEVSSHVGVGGTIDQMRALGWGVENFYHTSTGGRVILQDQQGTRFLFVGEGKESSAHFRRGNPGDGRVDNIKDAQLASEG